MFTVNISGWKDGAGIRHDEWTKLFDIPQDNGYFPIIRPVVKNDQTAADSLTFTIEQNSTYYDALIPFKTLFCVMYEDACIFFGRVLSINVSILTGTKNVTCEGAMAFLNDTYYEGKPEKKLEKTKTKDYFEKILNNHNENTEESWKKIYKGNLNMSNSDLNDSMIHEPTSWSDSYSCLKGLTSSYGGHHRVRVVEETQENAAGNGVEVEKTYKLYLDWYNKYLRDPGEGKRCKVEVNKNIFDISSTSEVDNVFTILIPTGGTDSKSNTIYLDGYKYTDKNGTEHTHNSKFFPVKLINDLYSDSDLNKDFHHADDYRTAQNSYGKIFKTQSFANADTQKKLWDYTKDWVKKNYYGMLESFSVKAIDMKIIGGDNKKILVGDVVDVVYPVVQNGIKIFTTRALVCKNISFDLFNPENNTYTFGIPSDLINYEYGKKNKTKASTPAGGNTKPPPTEDDKDKKMGFDEIANKILMASTTNTDYGGVIAKNSFLANGQLSGTVVVYDQTDYARYGTDAYFTAPLVGKYTSQSGKTFGVCLRTPPGLFNFQYSGNPPYKITHNYVTGRDAELLSYDSPTPVQTQMPEPTGTSGIFQPIVTMRDTATDKITSWINTALGKMGFNKSPSDNTDNTTVTVDGQNGKITAGKGDGKTQVEIDGEEGSATIGKEGEETTINKSVTYEDENGGIVTTRKSVASKDLLKADVLKAITKVISDKIFTNQLRVNEHAVVDGKIQALDFSWVTESDPEYISLQGCFYSFFVTGDDDGFSIQMYGANGRGESQSLTYPISFTAIKPCFKDASISGKVITFTRADGSTPKTITLPDAEVPDNIKSCFNQAQFGIKEENGKKFLTLTLTRANGGTVTTRIDIEELQL